MIAHQPELSAEEIDRIVNFLGYGLPSAPVWFMGIEEGLGNMNSQDISANLKARASFERTMDLREAHLRLREQGRPIDIEKQPPSTQVWQWMAKIMLAFQGIENWSDLISTDKENQSRARKHIQSCAKKYIQHRLGRSNGNTFLTELSPIPAAKTTDQNVMSWFKENDSELEVKITQRRAELNRMLKESPHSLVICYGYGNNGDRARDFAKFLEVEWQSVPDCPGVCRSGDSKRLLLPFFGNGQMSYTVFVDLIRSGLLG
ncbi:MAG TPA: hypothetical protein VL990_11215 [Acidobacteriaceae bacterium]|nr:hypothetical protein [Acidobacteriaceae bacterium]